jgi:hypothetical protein
MKKQILLFLFPLSVISCVQNEPSLLLINNSGEQYDSIHVFSKPSLPTTFNHFLTGDKRKGKILFENNDKSDGAYGIKLYKGGKVVRSEYFGYYTNGASLNSGFKITIEKDTIVIE